MSLIEEENEITQMKENYSREELLKMLFDIQGKNSNRLFEISNAISQMREQNSFLWKIIRALS